MVLIRNKLRELRESKGLTQKQLGELLGVSASTVSMYELDYRRPTYERLIRYVDIFNTSADFILSTSNQLKDNFSALDYEHRKSAEEYLEFLLKKQQDSLDSNSQVFK